MKTKTRIENTARANSVVHMLKAGTAKNAHSGPSPRDDDDTHTHRHEAATAAASAAATNASTVNGLEN